MKDNEIKHEDLELHDEEIHEEVQEEIHEEIHEEAVKPSLIKWKGKWRLAN